jgi:hypothetical protein
MSGLNLFGGGRAACSAGSGTATAQKPHDKQLRPADRDRRTHLMPPVVLQKNDELIVAECLT